jgi:hypothetical protein
VGALSKTRIPCLQTLQNTLWATLDPRLESYDEYHK